jgi:uncharacterized protein
MLPSVNKTPQFLAHSISWPILSTPHMTTTPRALVPRLLQLFMVGLLFAFASHSIAKDQYPAFDSHVTDSAGLLGTRAAVIDYKLRAHEAATGQQVFVLTVPTTGRRSIEEYAVGVFQEWRIGGAKKDDGVLFVIAVADREMRIEVGHGLEGRLTDARRARIIHNIVAPQLAQGQYVAGIESGVDAVLATLALPSAPADAPGAPKTVGEAGGDAGAVATATAITFFMLVLLVCVPTWVWFSFFSPGPGRPLPKRREAK